MIHNLIQGETIDEKFASLEVILSRFQRRLGNKVVGVMPPMPILHHQDLPRKDGTLFSGICPVDGTVKKICFKIGYYTYDTKDCEISLTIEGENLQTTLKRSIKKTIEVLVFDQPVFSGNVLNIQVLPADAVRDVLIGVLILPTMQQMVNQKHLLEAVLELEETVNVDIDKEKVSIS